MYLHLSVPKSRLRTFGDRAFCVGAPSLWNKLPHAIRSAPSLTTFKNTLKTHLFTEAYGLLAPLASHLSPPIPSLLPPLAVKASLGFMKGSI